jgi:hypothetical protein
MGPVVSSNSNLVTKLPAIWRMLWSRLDMRPAKVQHARKPRNPPRLRTKRRTTDFANRTAVIMASGPSLSRDQLNHVEKRQSEAPDQFVTIAVNNTYKRAPWASDLYACDPTWWTAYGARDFTGRKWSQADNAAQYGATHVKCKPGSELNLYGDTIRTGGNSAFQAVNMAILFGAKRVVILGVDCQPTGGKLHWHEDHDTSKRLSNPNPGTYRIWLDAWDNAARQLKERTDVEFINASAQSALQSWPRLTIEEALKEPLDGWRT